MFPNNIIDSNITQNTTRNTNDPIGPIGLCAKGGIANAKIAFGIYGAQLLLNLAWSFLFFGAQSPFLGLIDIIPLFILIIINAVIFWKIDRLAGILMVPYALWVSFAMLLNGSIYFLNT